MHVSKLFSLCFFVALSGLGLSGLARADDEPLHNELRRFKSEMESAMNSGDMDAVFSKVEDDVVFTTMNNDFVAGKEKLREYFVKMVGSPSAPVAKIKTSLDPEALSIFLDPERNLALSYGKANDEYLLKGGATLGLHARWTALLSKRTGQWKVAAFHYSGDIFHSPIHANAQKALVGLALVLGAIGLGAGYWLGRRRRAA
jgi:ketosteroid isomerase-like protein